MRVQITWMGESGFLIEDQTTALLIDPYFDKVQYISHN